MVMHPPSKMERDSLEHEREEGANPEEMTSEEVEMLHDALSNVPTVQQASYKYRFIIHCQYLKAHRYFTVYRARESPRRP
jgi:hypothetical protein